MKFAHMSDVHLGSWGSNPEMKEFSIRAFETAIDRCYSEGVGFILIAGDFFDTSLPSIDILRRAVSKIRECRERGIRVYAVPGSHDFSPTGRTFLNVLEDAGLIVLVDKNEEIEGKVKLAFHEDESGAKIAGMAGKMGALEAKHFERIDRESLEREGGFRIFLFHSGIEEYKPEILKDMNAVPLAWLPKNLDYYATGHVHQTLLKKEDGYGTIAFPGPLFPTDLKELEHYNSGFFVTEVSGVAKTKFVPVKLFDVEVIRISADGKSLLQAEEEIMEGMESRSLKGRAVLLKVSGTLKSGKPSDMDMNRISSKAAEKGALIVKKNFSKFFSREFEEVETGRNLSIENMEKELIMQNSPSMKLAHLGAGAQERIIFDLMKIFDDEKKEGETNYTFEARLNGNAKKLLDL